jgi:hypothetical protein
MQDIANNTEFADAVGWMLYHIFSFISSLWSGFSWIIVIFAVLGFITLTFSVIARILRNESS